jgi:hypothetical protein
MHDLILLIRDHWGVTVLAVVATFKATVDLVANSLPAPTANATQKYIFWFKFVNNASWNWNRAKNLARIQDSPNFIPAAEAYMQQKLREQQPR